MFIWGTAGKGGDRELVYYLAWITAGKGGDRELVYYLALITAGKGADRELVYYLALRALLLNYCITVLVYYTAI